MASRQILMVAGLTVLGLTGISAGPTGAKPVKPTIKQFAATSRKLTIPNGQTTIYGLVSNATSCTISATPALAYGSGSLSCVGGTFSDALTFPLNISKKAVSYKITLGVSGLGGTSQRTIHVRVAPGAGGGSAPSITSASSTTFAVGASMSFTVTTTGEPVPGITETGPLPSGVTLSDNHNGTATLSGMPASGTVGTYPITITADNGIGSAASQDFSLTVASPALLTGVQSIATTVNGYCTLLTSGEVDCWGDGESGELGDGEFSNSSIPVQVQGVGVSGLLSGVASVASDGNYDYCALLTSGEVDCWGYGENGQLGNGQFYSSGDDGSAIPVQVVGVGGTGILSGVTNLTSDDAGYCALLTSGEVDCWGFGENGQLGNGQFYSSGDDGSAIPVQVVGVGGTGILSGVASLTSIHGVQRGYCALLSSGEVTCWGAGSYGQLGNGQYYTSGNGGSATPVQVVGVGGTGILSGVTSLTGGLYQGYCGLLTAGEVDCWGYGYEGQLGNGQFYTSDSGGSASGSATPVQVMGVGGTGILSGVTSLIPGIFSFCGLLASGDVDCWGGGGDGELGNGQYYTSGNGGSATPVQVTGVGGTGILSEVISVASEAIGSFCALLTTGGVDCWGDSYYGQLGNGQFSESATPVQVVGVGGVGTLSGVISMTSQALGSFCALLTTGAVNCWGQGSSGQLGNGQYYTSGNDGDAVPVEVLSLP